MSWEAGLPAERGRGSRLGRGAAASVPLGARAFPAVTPGRGRLVSAYVRGEAGQTDPARRLQGVTATAPSSCCSLAGLPLAEAPTARSAQGRVPPPTPPPPALSLPRHLRCPVKHRPHSGTSAASPTAPQPPRGGARPGLRLRPPPPAFATQGFEAAPLSTMFQPRRGPWPGSVNLSGKRVTSSFPRPSAKASVSFPRGQR